jgi:UDP-2-acetamido-2-deoxy-ribo-hexuluronate aminotransferase
MMKIPFYGIKRFYEENSREILDVVHGVYSGGMLFGEDTLTLEKDLCGFTWRKYAVTVGSCTDALFFALKSAGVGRGDEVLITSFSFIASVSPVLRVGAVPVFTDIDPYTCLMDVDDMESKITAKTKAILAVHLFGQTLDIEKIERIAQKNHIIVIEDVAQGLGAMSGKRHAGSMGQVSCLSFDPTKVISAFGSGGAVLTDDEQIYKQIKKLRYHGKGDADDYLSEGYNCRLSAPQCALLSYQLKFHLDKRIARLREIASIYHDQLHPIDGLSVPVASPDNFHIYHKYAIRSNQRDELKLRLRENGIESMVHYTRPLYEYSLFKDHPYKADDIVHCKPVCRDVLSLPIYPELTEHEIEYICLTIKNFYKNIDLPPGLAEP